MSLENSKVGDIFTGDQISFRRDRKLLFGTVMGFGYTAADGVYQPYLKIAEYPKIKVLISQVEKITKPTTDRKTK